MVAADEYDELSKATQRRVESPRRSDGSQDLAPYTTSHQKQSLETQPTSDLKIPSPEATIAPGVTQAHDAEDNDSGPGINRNTSDIEVAAKPSAMCSGQSQTIDVISGGLEAYDIYSAAMQGGFQDNLRDLFPDGFHGFRFQSSTTSLSPPVHSQRQELLSLSPSEPPEPVIPPDLAEPPDLSSPLRFSSSHLFRTTCSLTALRLS
ncbi:hypothetical protein Bca101_010078 [Brassica carinata]